MTVSADDAIKTYPGNGVAIIFNGPRLFDADTLTVTEIDDALQTITTPTYTVSLVGTNGPSRVVLDVATAVGKTLILERIVPYDQSTDFTNQQTLHRQVVEQTFDLKTFQIQQLAAKQRLTLSFPSSLYGSFNPVLPLPVAGAPLVFDPVGGGIIAGDMTLTGDLALRPNLASDADGAGSDLVAFPDTLGTAYLKTLSDIENGRTVSIFRFINPLLIAAIKDRTSFANVAAMIQMALSSGAKGLQFFDGLYRLESGLTLTGKTDFSLLSDGAVFNLQGAITGLTVTASDGLRATGELNFTGLNTATGFNISGVIDSEFANWRAQGLLMGGILGNPQDKTFGGITVPDQTRISNFYAQGCGTGLQINGEYYEILSPQVKECVTGIWNRGGNNSIVGGTVNGNRVGVLVDGSFSGNGDHGKLVGVTINHNLAAGLYVKDTNFSWHITGCDIWASIGDGTANGQLTEEGRTTSFGVYLKNCENINLTGNTIARNRVNVGIDGLITSILSPNNLISDPARTTSHIKEYGASHTVGVNAQNIYDPNLYEGALLGGGTKRVEVLATTSSRTNKIGGSLGTTGLNYDPIELATVGDRTYDGNTNALVLNSDATVNVSVSPSVFELDFKVLFTSVNGGAKAIDVIGALSLIPFTADAVIAGTTVTFRSTGLYSFTSFGAGRWGITKESGNDPVLVPTLINSWANLGAGFEEVGFWKDSNGDVVLRGVMDTAGAAGTSAFVLPLLYRPAAGVVMPLACNAGKAGSVIVNPDGTVVPSYEAASTFCSLSGLRFRVN